MCWLVGELAREHRAGEHERPNASCIACTRTQERAPTSPTAHAECDHDATPGERAKCRRRRQRLARLRDV